MNTKRKPGRKMIIVLSALTALLLFLSLYHLFHAPTEVDQGIARLKKIFRHHTSDIWVVKFLPDGTRLASCSVDGTVKIFSLASGTVSNMLQHSMGVTHMDISRDGRLIATTCYDTRVRVWDATQGTLLRELTGHGGTPWAVHFSPDGRSLLSSGEDKVIRIWDVESGRLLRTLQGHTRNVWDARFSPDGRTIASGSFDAKVMIWDAATGALLNTLDDHTEAVVSLIYSHNGKMLATTSDDKTIRLWNTADYSPMRTLKQPEHPQAVAFSPDDQRLLTGGRDKTALGEMLQSLFGDSEYNKGVSARLWDIGSGSILQTFSLHGNDANDVTWSPDGKWIATGSSDKTVALWEVIK